MPKSLVAFDHFEQTKAPRLLLLIASWVVLSAVCTIAEVAGAAPTNLTVSESSRRTNPACEKLFNDHRVSPKSAPQTATWTPNLSTRRGQVDLFVSILRRHANFLKNNTRFRRNVIETFSHIPKLIENLGDNAQSLEIVAPQVWSVSYFGQAVQFNEEALARFRSDRIADIDKVQIQTTKNLIEEITRLRANRDGLKALYRLIPFLFDERGESLYNRWDPATQSTVIENIQASGPAQLESGYMSFLNDHIDAVVSRGAQANRLGEAAQTYRTFKNQFVERDVRALIKPINIGRGQSALRAISIESIPVEVAVARGYFGGDCSILSIPFYSLLKGVMVHVIRKTKDLSAEPDGYVLTASVKINDDKGTHTIPYILTINGVSLSHVDVRVVAYLVQQSDPNFKNTSLVAFPDWVKNKHLVNWDAARTAMTHIDGTHTSVILPAGWDVVTAYHEQNFVSHVKDYYVGDKIQTAVVGAYSPGVQFFGAVEHRSLSIPTYLQPNDLENTPVLNRAIIALDALENAWANPIARQEILSMLKVTESQARAALNFTALSPYIYLDLKSYRILERELQVGIKNLLALPSKTRSNILPRLYFEAPEVFVEHNARRNSQAKDVVIQTLGGSLVDQSLYKVLWDDPKISDLDLIEVLKFATAIAGRTELWRIIEKSEEFKLPWSVVSRQLAWAFLMAPHNDATISSSLLGFHSSTSPLFDAIKNLIATDKHMFDYLSARYPGVIVFREVLKYRKDHHENFDETYLEWIADPDIKPALKADFMIVQIGRGEVNFNRFLQRIPPHQISEFWRRMNRRTTFRPFYELAKLRNMTGYFFHNANPQNFLYSTQPLASPANPITFKMGDDQDGPIHQVTLTHPIQVSIAPEADFMWELLTGTNPSASKEVLDYGLGRPMNSHGRPVENVTWWSVLMYANKRSEIEGREPVFDFSRVQFSGRFEDGSLTGQGEVRINWNANGYRPLTESELEATIRAGTTTKFPTGDTTESLEKIRPWKASSQQIAMIDSNPWGFVDTVYNVASWTLDWFGPYPSNHVIDPTGAPTGTEKVIRGGGFNLPPDAQRSAARQHADPNSRLPFAGVRFVRGLR